MIQTENHRMLMENLELLEEIRALSNPRVIEQHAREKIGYTRPNERVFIVE
jgi:cell division protein FtsB